MSWIEAIATVLLMLLVAAIGTGVGALVGWALGRPDLGAAVGWAPAMLAWVAFGAFVLSKDEPA